MIGRRAARRIAVVVALLVIFAIGVQCAGDGGGTGETVEVRIPDGAGARTVAHRLEEAGLVGHAGVFSLYMIVRGADDELKAGHYEFRRGASWGELVGAIEAGRVKTVPVTVPEGLTLAETVARLASVTGVPADSILRLATDSAVVAELGVPGPTLEGYLFPETYRFAQGVSPRTALRTMVERYRAFWNEEARARADSLGLSEQDVVTLASIVEEEARVDGERPVIAGVYLNRLERGMRLQADPTVQYALESPKPRLFYRDIERTSDNPYNTYTHSGLPPGPIASPGTKSLRAVLQPADVPYLFFVARPDGSHIFSRTQAEHEQARERARRLREEREREAEQDADAAPGDGERAGAPSG